MAEMQQMRKVPPSVAKKKTEKVKEMPKVKITGTASTKPRVSTSMIKSQPATTVKPKTTPKAPAKTPVKTPVKMTPQDAAMKKLLEKKYGKIYG